MEPLAGVAVQQCNGYPIKEGSVEPVLWPIVWSTDLTVAIVSSERLLSKRNEVCSCNMADQEDRG